MKSNKARKKLQYRRLSTGPVLGLAFLNLPPHVLSFTCHNLHTWLAFLKPSTSNNRRQFSIKSNQVDQQESDTTNSRWKQTPFDFSSKQGWDKFYQKGQELPVDDDVPSTLDANTSLEYEWHSHIPHSAIIDVITPSIQSALKHSTPQNKDKIPSILVIGCGNSSLPRVLHNAFSHPVRITCLDYSSVCIDMIREMYGDSCPNMDFVVGDAMKLKEALDTHNNLLDGGEEYRYDVVIDKGLMDALMCGEGFDIDNLQKGLDQVLTENSWGIHVLICFPLSKGVKESLVELGQPGRSEKCQSSSSLFWTFNLPVEGSENGRASFNVGRRCL